MSWQFLGHPLMVMAGAVAISTVMASMVEPLAPCRVRLLGLNVNTTVLATVACCSMFGACLFVMCSYLRIPNGGPLSVIWPLMLAQSLIGQNAVKDLRSVDVATMLVIVAAAGYLALKLASMVGL